jgi:hypothetical protein
LMPTQQTRPGTRSMIVASEKMLNRRVHLANEEKESKKVPNGWPVTNGEIYGL